MKRKIVFLSILFFAISNFIFAQTKTNLNISDFSDSAKTVEIVKSELGAFIVFELENSTSIVSLQNLNIRIVPQNFEDEFFLLFFLNENNRYYKTYASPLIANYNMKFSTESARNEKYENLLKSLKIK